MSTLVQKMSLFYDMLFYFQLLWYVGKYCYKMFKYNILFYSNTEIISFILLPKWCDASSRRHIAYGGRLCILVGVTPRFLKKKKRNGLPRPSSIEALTYNKTTTDRPVRNPFGRTRFN